MAWFKDWFNSPYYHLLYGKRDTREAEMFIHALAGYLKPEAGARMLDLACGKGRHSKILSGLGYDVTGVDLSENSIAEARESETDTLRFFVHDMRKTFSPETFDYIFNLFTSFGYFEHEADNMDTLKAIHEGLRPGGILVQDYFNAFKVQENYKSSEKKEVEGITFDISKEVLGKRIIKTISFHDGEHPYTFQEKVCLFTLDDFERMYAHAGFRVQAVFGDYQLNPFNPGISERLILISSKI
jgi:SAM-dependent methyltransferase